MKSRKEKLSYLRKKDFISILITTVASVLIFILLKRYFLATSEVSIFSYIGFLGAIIVVIISYFESKSEDPFVTGKTLTLGVMNSFVAAAVVIVLLSFKFGLILSVIAIDILIIIARELGRNNRQKMINKYMNRTGKIVKDCGKGKYIMDLNSQNVNVYSKDKLILGNNVKVSELNGTYIYVEKID